MDIIMKRLVNSMRYAYHAGSFLAWDAPSQKWRESNLMNKKFERAKAAVPTMTPESFLTENPEFVPLDKYEADPFMIDALKNIDSAKEESACTTSTPDASPQNNESAPSEANASVSSALTSAPPMSCTPDAPIGTPSGMNPPDKPLTTIPDDLRPTFDYSGLSDQTVADLHLAENEYMQGRKMAERGLIHMGNAIATAHDALCGTVVQQLDNGQFAKKEDTFRMWCLSIGISKSSAYNLLQVSALLENSSPRQKEILETLPPTLLYAAAKPSAPQELVERVQTGDITTNKQYQEALKQLKEKDAQLKLSNKRIDELQAHSAKLTCDYNDEFVKRRHAESKLDETRARLKSACVQEQESREAMQAAESARDAALADVQGLSEQNRKLKDENASLKKRPITAVIDEEEVDKRAGEKAYQMAADMTAELKADRDELQRQLDEAHSAPSVDPQEDLENVIACRVNLESAWSMARSCSTRLVGSGENLNNALHAIISLCDSIHKEAVALIIRNDKETQYE